MENRTPPIELVDTLGELLQDAQFDASDLQQRAPVREGKDSVADQLHRIRLIVMQLRAELSRFTRLA